MTTIEDFSSGYLKTTMQVAPYDDGPVVEQGFYDYLNTKYYGQTDAPPMFRLGLDGEPYFEVNTESAVPTDHLAIPEDWFHDARIKAEYDEQDVYILKPGYTHLLKQSETLDQRFNEDEVMDDG